MKTTPDCADFAQSLLEAEAPARVAVLGIWAEPETALRSPEQTGRWVDSQQVVEGVVTAARLTKTALYLDFGADWRRGLGVKIGRRLIGKLPGDALALAGRRVRVRGWIGKGIGPLMELNHVAQIEAPDGWPQRGEARNVGEAQ